MGKVAEHLAGAYGSVTRREWEDTVTEEVSKLIHPIVHPFLASVERTVFVGVSSSHAGTNKAILSVLTCGLPDSAIMAVEGVLRQGVSVKVAGDVTVPLNCHLQPGSEPAGCITVLLTGTDLPRQAGAVATILQAVGYSESATVHQEFWGSTKFPGYVY